MKKITLLLLAATIIGCGKDTAEKVAGTYDGTFNLAGYSAGQGTATLTQIGDNKLRLNFQGAGAGPYLVSGISVQEQTYNHYGLGYAGQVYTFTGSVDDANNLNFYYTGDTIYLSFNGVKQ